MNECLFKIIVYMGPLEVAYTNLQLVTLSVYNSSPELPCRWGGDVLRYVNSDSWTVHVFFERSQLHIVIFCVIEITVKIKRNFGNHSAIISGSLLDGTSGGVLGQLWKKTFCKVSRMLYYDRHMHRFCFEEANLKHNS